MKTSLAVLLVVFLVTVIGCSQINAPPSLPPEMPRRGTLPRSYKMKLAVFNLQDPTRSGGRLTESVAEMLHGDLFKTERFELMERAEIRGIDPGDIENIKKVYRTRLDALVVGSITQFRTDQKTMTLEIRVMNAYGLTMAAESFSVRYTGAINVDADDEDIQRIAEWIERAFPKLESGMVIARSEDTITVNLGSDDGVQRGMWVLIAARGDNVKDPKTGEQLGSDIYIGEGYAIGVNPGSCLVQLVIDSRTNRMPFVRVSDKVIFK